ncbi:ATP synthase subunit O, mitochondrial, partial [Hyalella azteca]|uniref:Oligomycin sensitivity conferral protein n=1 Tax=Hyalella azteca TaxID=294128 RepID=A0A8B7NEY7_HYAAZ
LQARQLSTSSASQQLVKAPVQLFTLEGRYATALYSAASKQKALPQVEKDLKEFGSLLKTDKPLKELLLNPLLKKELKKEALNFALTKKKANNLTINLFGALAENNRLAKVDAVLSSFDTIMAAERGEVVCEVTTAKPLDAAGQKEVQAALGAFLKKGETLNLTMKVDPSIIGGMVVSIGDKYVDMSIASKINKYTQVIQQTV